MTSAISLIAENIINLVYPAHCSYCQKSLDDPGGLRLCQPCRNGIRQNPKPNCESCGRPVEDAAEICDECREAKPHYSAVCSAYIYEGALKELIHIFKYKPRLSLAEPLTDLLIEYLKDNRGILTDTDTVTFVPLDNRRLRERGFNQSRILAAGLSKKFGIPLSDLLEKTGRTRHQNELSRDERLVNLKGAFKVRGSASLTGLKVLLIDDIMTTGSTLNECAKTLLDTGAREVRCVTLARGI